MSMTRFKFNIIYNTSDSNVRFLYYLFHSATRSTNMNFGLLGAQYHEYSIEERIYSLRKIVKYDIPEPVEYYFRDGIRQTHYIIVIQDRQIYKKSALERILRFLYFLEFQGLQFEFEMGMKDTDLVYVKVHATESVIKHYANLYDIDIDDAGHNYIADTDLRFKYRQTELTKNDKDIFKRKGKPTSGEIIILIYKILSDPLTFEEKEVYGIDKMITLGYIKDAFPIHDGPWDYRGVPMEIWNDRQKLSYYWANFPMWYKEVPINLVEKYFGTAISFYFAWTEYYLNMLFIISVIGLSSLLLNFIIFLIQQPSYIQQVCATHDQMMCPICDSEGCHLAPLSNYCVTSKLENIFGTTIQFAVIITIWVAVFYKWWMRRECTLSVRWNVHDTDVEYKIRYGYKDKTSYFKKSKITGKIEPFVPVGTRIYRHGFTHLVLLILMSFVVGYVLLLSAMKHFCASLISKVPEPSKSLILNVIYGACQAFFIKICSLFYVAVSVLLTNIQVPKTESEYENSVIYKIYLFGFLTNYLPILYSSLIRFNLILLPGATLISFLNDDNCLPTGCIVTLAVQLMTITFIKYAGEFFWILARTMTTGFKTDNSIPTWEREYYLSNTIKLFMITEFSEIMIQFGYVSFFMAMCPVFGPIVFFSNIFRNKLNAIKLVRQIRRPIPRKCKGIGAWNDIVLFSSYFSVVCNAFIIGFNTRLILYVVHHMFVDVKKSFFDFIFSTYALDDLPNAPDDLNDTNCIFMGNFHPPIHKYKYRKTNEHYAVQSAKLAFIIIYENFSLLVIGILYYFVNNMPRRVKEQLRRDKMFVKDIKMKILEKKLLTRLSRGSSMGQSH